MSWCVLAGLVLVSYGSQGELAADGSVGAWQTWWGRLRLGRAWQTWSSSLRIVWVGKADMVCRG